MRLFLSYASEDRSRAEEIALALKGDGHAVFFDGAALAGGESYSRVIRERMAEADLLVFLISPHSVEPGSYTLTELRMAQDRWESPNGRVVPVLIAPTVMDTIPAYLRAVTLFEPKGNAAAEIAAHLSKLGRRRRQWLWSAVVVVLAIAAGLSLWVRGRREPVAPGPAFVSKIAESDFVSAFVMRSEQIERTEYALDPTARFPDDRGDVVRLERMAFGRLSDDTRGFSVQIGVNNTTDDPILLDLTPRFFELADDQGRRAELLYFCCEAKGDLLGRSEQRRIQLIYRAQPSWEGKETTPGYIHLRVLGLLPVVRATWTFRPLATAE